MFSYKKVSVTDVSQKFENKAPLPLKTLPNVPFLYHHHHHPPQHHSFICLILSIHPQKNAVLYWF